MSNPSPKDQLAKIFSADELAQFAEPVKIQNSGAVTAALGGIGLGDVAVPDGLPPTNNTSEPPSAESAPVDGQEKNRLVWPNISLAALESVKNGGALDVAEIAQALNLEDDQIAMTQAEWNRRQVKVFYLHDSLLLNGPQSFEGRGTIFPAFVKGYVALNGLITSRGLSLPQYIGDSLHLDELGDSEWLRLPEHVGSCVTLDKLESVKNLKAPDRVGSFLSLGGLESMEAFGRVFSGFKGTVIVPKAFEDDQEVIQVKQHNPDITVIGSSY